MALEQRERARRDWDKILRLENVLMNSKLARTPEIHGYESVNRVFHLTYAVVHRTGTIIDQLSLVKRGALPGPPMKRRNAR